MKPYESPEKYMTLPRQARGKLGSGGFFQHSTFIVWIPALAYALAFSLRTFQGPVVNHLEVAVPTPLARTFTYLADSPVPPGMRVLVPFGRRRVVGVALGPAQAELEAGTQLKKIEKILDDTPSYSETVLAIARWISTYYMHPLGEVLRTMLPASSEKVAKDLLALTPEGEQARSAASTSEGQFLKLLFGKKKTEMSYGAALGKSKRLAGEATIGSDAFTVRQLVKSGLVVKRRGSTMRAREMQTEEVERAPEPLSPAQRGVAPELRPAQRQAVDRICQALRPTRDGSPAAESKVFLLHGVTGSGKTEVYIQLIEEVLKESGHQALLLVPEISLTPQMTQVFERRFPGIVAVVHSAMTDIARWQELQRIRAGTARILIGPRSAVFGPFGKLALILVDEEHDGSYKQSTGLTYNGRDVAVLRGKLEKAAVVLGSATPSMESYQNALAGRYELLEMPERVTGRPLPEINIIPCEKKRGLGTVVKAHSARPHADDVQADERDDIPIDPKILEALEQNRLAGRQAIVLVNRRGYAYYLFSLQERQAVPCPNCSISLTLHARSTVLRCHYCDYKTTVERIVAERPGDTLIAVGYGSQKAEDCLAAKLPKARITRLDSDIVVDREVLPKVLEKFRRGDIDILVGTQILAKGHDFPNVTLIVILEVDQLLNLPDFRAGERTFQLIVQAAGRAGRADLPGKVLIQTVRAENPLVLAALEQDYKGFAASELKFRRAHEYPPFTRMIAIEINGPHKPRLETLCTQMERWQDELAVKQPNLAAKVRILGPSVPPIETIRGRHRRTVIFSSGDLQALRTVSQAFVTAFGKLPPKVRLRIDVDPQSLI
ncbi:primosomal protein N' [Planctomyces bekefii]|uniref:Replication restart protein PriA n=1 Tax=Planctomyces bekefii TaxID=1653850 RepID=A0A5C6MDJ0_9PLAN|nr:primosomal protein N' [Planctomyces bekefii]